MESVAQPREDHLAPPQRPFGLAAASLCLLAAACSPAAPPERATALPGHPPPVQVAAGDSVTEDAPPAQQPAAEPERQPPTEKEEAGPVAAAPLATPQPVRPDGETLAARPGKSAAAPSSVDDLLDNALTGSRVTERRRAATRERLIRNRPAPHRTPAPKMKRDSRASVSGLGALGRSAGQGYGSSGAALAPGADLLVAEAPPQDFHTEAYAHLTDNPFHQVSDEPLSTFSIDVDTASYSNVRRFLTTGSLPPADAVRIEEMVNYFTYDYEAPGGADPFSVNTEVSVAPWNPRHRLVHIGLQGRTIDDDDVPARNLVFLLDVSGSMNRPDKLPLLKQGMAMLARQLRPEDRIAIVVYAGASGMVLPSVSGAEQGRILSALERLRAGGSTNGADGIQLAYRVAQERFIAGGINRVILATDGDFNVGVTSQGELTRLIEAKRRSGVFLTVLGFGTGNVKDSTMELLADKGNGNYAYIDSAREAHKVLVREAGSTLVTIAKDVKLQIEFNPARVESYRLIGYENRVLAARDFNDDKKDAGEIGAGHSVTALYEVVPRRGATEGEVDALKYQADRPLTSAADSDELLTVKLRYKHPEADTSKRISRVVRDRGTSLEQTSADFRWSAAVAGFGMLLRGSEHRGNATLDMVMRLARGALGRDRDGDRRELIDLMRSAGALGLGQRG